MKTIFALAACAALTACASAPGKYDNAVLCTLNCDRAFVAVLLGSFGATLELRQQDARELARMRAAAPAPAASRPAP